MTDGPWVHCPSLGRTPVPVSDRASDGVRTVACPVCWWAYPTTIDRPLLPSHWINRESGDVMVKPTAVVDLR